MFHLAIFSFLPSPLPWGRPLYTVPTLEKEVNRNKNVDIYNADLGRKLAIILKVSQGHTLIGANIIYSTSTMSINYDGLMKKNLQSEIFKQINSDTLMDFV